MSYSVLQLVIFVVGFLVVGYIFGCWAAQTTHAEPPRRAGAGGEAEAEPVRQESAAEEAPAPSAQPESAAAPGGDSGSVDDLKRISGVGPALEEKLNDMGITRYAQIAAWTRADIDAVDEKLNFKGRIDREDWIGQAQKLAAGETTDFAGRVDRGEVESSSS